MPNQFGLAGANPGKQTKFAPIYNPRWSSGLWTNRSPLRDAATTRITEKYYGAAGDALIDGSNVEITNRLTLARRPGNSTYPPNKGHLTPNFVEVDRFYDFRLFNAAQEEIILMIDQAATLSALPQGSILPKQIWTKDPEAGQSYMQSVGNILYWGDGIDNKKWLQSLFKWTADTQLNTTITPYLSTYLIDPHGNIQQFTGTAIPISYVYVQSDTVQIITNIDISQTLTAGQVVTFPSGMTASFLNNQTVTITVVGSEPFGNSFFFNFITPNYPQTPETGKYAVIYPGDGKPFTGPTEPAWSAIVPSAANNFSGGLTHDGAVVWTNRGNPVENWGIEPPPTAVVPVVYTSASNTLAWHASTVYSRAGVVLDSNGNLQLLTQAGTSGAAVTWNPIFGGFSYDGTAPTQNVWKLIASGAMMNFSPSRFYQKGSYIIAAGCLFVSATAGTTGSFAPSWPAWSTAFAPAYPTVTSGGLNGVTFNNLGPITDFTWYPSTTFTLPNTNIIDGNGFRQFPYRTGKSGTTIPTAFSATVNGLTNDHPNLIWINAGPSGLNPSFNPVGQITTTNGGWVYAVSLVNTLDDTVSNATPVSASTGNFTGADGVKIAPGAGLPPIAQIDSQADYVAIWRSTDGLKQPFLIPGPFDFNLPITIPLSQYLVSGYLDTTPDTGLNNLIEAPILGENTPPTKGAINLVFYLNRLFYSIGNTVEWTSGPDTPTGNGLNGSAPLNFDEQESLVKRLVPNTQGLIVFTVSDINFISTFATGAQGVIPPAVPMLSGIGLASYNALDVNGSIIGFFSTDSQFIIIDPANGATAAGFPIGDQLLMNNGKPGQSWTPANAYVAWHVSGYDQAWYLADGKNGWYRLMATPAPESGSFTWSPFATIATGCKALQSVETSPGVHELLLGPTGNHFHILSRDLDSSLDATSTYPCSATLGSMVLAEPGQYAILTFVVTESVKVGTPLVLSLLVDDAYPYYTGPFDILKNWKSDPPNLAPSRSILGQRFYMSEMENDAAMLRHCQLMVTWAAENFPNELLTTTLYGGYIQED